MLDNSAVKLTGTNVLHQPSGFHIGAWRVGDKVYKPLSARNQHELAILEDMAGQPLFPRNWWIETVQEQDYLVRNVAHIIGHNADLPYAWLNRKQCLWIECAVLNANKRGWEINDALELGMDKQTRELFLFDLSIAQPLNPHWVNQTSDSFWLEELWKAAGQEWLVKLRRNAADALWERDPIDTMHRGLKHVYASFNRPLSPMWARLPENALLVHNERHDWESANPHTWILSPDPLDQDILDQYELTWGHSVI